MNEEGEQKKHKKIESLMVKYFGQLMGFVNEVESETELLAVTASIINSLLSAVASLTAAWQPGVVEIFRKDPESPEAQAVVTSRLDAVFLSVAKAIAVNGKSQEIFFKKNIMFIIEQIEKSKQRDTQKDS